MVRVTGRAALKVRAHPRELFVGPSAGQFELDVAVELLVPLVTDQDLTTGRSWPTSFTKQKTKGPRTQAFRWWS